MDLEFIDLSETTGVTPEASAKITPYPKTTTHIIKSGWSEEVCRGIAKEGKFPKNLKDAKTQREMIVQFITFYFTGAVDIHYNLTDVILFVACMIFTDKAKTTSELIWEEEDYQPNESNVDPLFSAERGTAVDITPKETLEQPSLESLAIKITVKEIQPLAAELEYNNTPTTSKGPTVRKEDNIEELIKSVGPLLNKYGVTGTQEFFNYCNAVLSRSPPNNAPTREALELYKLMNFVALTMLRATTKTAAQMTTGFLKRQYKANVATFVDPIFGEKFTPPCSLAVQKTVTYIKKSNKQISCIFAKIVIASIDIGGITKSRLDAAVLTHTSWHGLGILQMLFDICEFFSKSWVEVYNLTVLSSTALSWKAIVDHMKTYQNAGKVDNTVPWARIIDDAYLTKYNPQNHPVLAALFKRSLEYAQGDEGGIGDSVWAQRHYRIVEQYAAGSEWVLSQLNQEDVQVQAGHQNSSKLAQIMNAQKKVTISHQPINTAGRFDDI